MKVLQINSVCGIGSTGRIATDIHHMLIEQGHESVIAYGRDLPKNCNHTIRIGTKFDFYTHVVKTRLFDKHGYGSRLATIKFINKVKQIDPDVIHLHNIHGYYINVEVLFSYLKEANKPVFWTLHDCWSFTGHCSHFDFAGCEKWIKGCYDCPEKKVYPKSLMFDSSKENYIRKKAIFTGVKNLTIITPSQWLADKVKKSFLSEYPVKVINNGIDLEVFRATASDFRDRFNLGDKLVILAVASVWNQRKGFNEYIELSYELNRNEIIVMVGVTEKQKKDLPSNILGITKTTDIHELAGIYSNSDVFVNLTLEDNYPTVNLEAIACGTPVLTYDTGGARETLTDLKRQLLPKKMRKEDIIELIRKYKVVNMSKTNKEYLNKNQAFSKYYDAYLELLYKE